MSCGDRVWRRLCCCCTGSNKATGIQNSQTNKSEARQAFNDGKSKSASDDREVISNELKRDPTETSNVDAFWSSSLKRKGQQIEIYTLSNDISDADDSEKFRYSGRNFDVINLEDDTTSEDEKDEEQDDTTDTLEVPKKPRKAGEKFKFTSTRRGAKKDAVYDKFSQF